MFRPRRLFAGVLSPEISMPFLLLPHNPEGGDGGGGDGGGSGSDGAGAGADGAGAGNDGASGKSTETKFEDMSPEDREAFWKKQARINEDKLKSTQKQLNEAKPKLDEYNRLIETSKTEQDKALEAAKADGAKAVRDEVLPAMVKKLVHAEFRAAASGRLTNEQVSDILAPLDTTHFLNDAGDIDTDKVAAYVEKVAPATGGDGGGKKWPGTDGQGRQQGGGQATGIDAGRDLYESRKKNRQPSAAGT